MKCKYYCSIVKLINLVFCYLLAWLQESDNQTLISIRARQSGDDWLDHTPHTNTNIHPLEQSNSQNLTNIIYWFWFWHWSPIMGLLNWVELSGSNTKQDIYNYLQIMGLKIINNYFLTVITWWKARALTCLEIQPCWCLELVTSWDVCQRQQ